MTKQTALYRFFDAQRRLLYVGITCDPVQRIRGHKATKEWWRQVVTIEMQHFDARVDAKRAETKAIKTEHPLYNIAEAETECVTMPAKPTVWNYYPLEWDKPEPFRAPLALKYEVSGTPLSDDYLPNEITALELYWHWRECYPEDEQRIAWFVDGPAVCHFEGAPFDRMFPECSFLEHYTWPEDEWGNRVNWLTLPLVDQSWTNVGNKGGFFQEVLRWRPAPFQSTVDVAVLERAAGLLQ